MIYSALYYPASLAKGDLIVRDNRFYPGKYLETLPVWMQYVRQHYPIEQITLFVDESSPIPFREMTALLGEPYFIHGYHHSLWQLDDRVKVHIRVLDQFAGQYFRPMQRNLVEALCMAYERNEGMLWIDSDCFVNSNLKTLIGDADIASSSVEHHQLTCGSFCWYVSASRLHALDGFCSLPTYLRQMVNEGPTETRMHSLQEGGLYKMFWYGKARAMTHINMSHLSCYPHFMQFLRDNPLPTPEYASLVHTLETLDMSRLAGVQMGFHDALHTERDGVIVEFA